jgi:hypothetical protein
MRIGHVCFLVRACKGIAARIFARPSLLHNRGSDDIIHKIGNSLRAGAFCERTPAAIRVSYERLFTLPAA